MQHGSPETETPKKINPRKVKNGAFVNCVVCGTPFYAWKTRIERGAKYCSMTCKGSVEKIRRICPQCGKNEVKHDSVYCGQQCYHEADRARRALARAAQRETVLA